MTNKDIIRVQISISNDELELIKVMEPLHDSSIEGAITNGIINQVIDNANKEVIDD